MVGGPPAVRDATAPIKFKSESLNMKLRSFRRLCCYTPAVTFFHEQGMVVLKRHAEVGCALRTAQFTKNRNSD